MEQPAPGTTPDPDRGFRLGFVPGVTPAKWARTWQERHRDVPLHLLPVAATEAELAVTAGELDAAILRPPVDRDVLHAIVLYSEVPVVVVARDHVLSALEDDEAVAMADLADEVLLQAADDVLPWEVALPGTHALEQPATTADAVALVAAGIGVLVVPQSLARLHHRKDVTYRVLADGPAAPVALSWAIEREDERTEDLIGIVRGRTVNSSRGRAQPESPPRRPARATASKTPRGRSRGGRRPRR